MNYAQIQQAIQLLTQAVHQLQSLTTPHPNSQNQNQTVRESEALLKQALASLSAAVNPPQLDSIPPEILNRLEALGIPFEDIEVQVALSSHHLSQIMGALAEIENRAETIRRKREYFLVRLPDIPVEPLGSRLPVVSAADFDWPQEATPKEIRDAIKAKYNLDRLAHRKVSRSSLFEKITEAQQILEPTHVSVASDFDEDELPF